MRFQSQSKFLRLLLVLPWALGHPHWSLAQSAPIEPPPRTTWTAAWISHPTAPLREPAVFHFRKEVNLPATPAQFLVNVSADNRYILYVNGARIGEGPARGDLANWRYEQFDLAPELKPGLNVIAAVVWNFGVYAPIAQMSNRSAFLLQGQSELEQIVDSNDSWDVEQESGLSFIPRQANHFWFYWAADPAQRLDASAFDWAWMKSGISPASHWTKAKGAIRESIYPDASTAASRQTAFERAWALTPDTLPQMEYRPAQTGAVVRTNFDAARSLPNASVTIPPHTSAQILIDRGTMISGYPVLFVSGGKAAKVALTYSEALYDADQKRGDRNEVGSRQALGLTDEFIADGSAGRRFQPLWFRTWRYLQLTVNTGPDPITIDRLETIFSAYPFEERASFTSSDPELKRIWDICWRSARLAAHETYMDTPVWEQLQYIDDSQIQALISYTVAGDARLARQALRAFDQSRVPSGLTQSRYPSLLPQFIPNFSLTYLDMLHEYWMYEPDPDLIRELLPGTRSIADWFVRHQRPDGFLDQLPFWIAIDVPQGVKTFPRSDKDGRSSLVTLLFVHALRNAAELEDALGDAALAANYRTRADRAAAAVMAQCWNSKVGLLADTPEQTSYSQHANIFGILTDTIPISLQQAVMGKLLNVQTLPDAAVGSVTALVSLHYQFFLSRAMEKTGAAPRYVQTLAPWREMLRKGMTTTPEYADPTRSDTHAWSAHPIYDMLTLIAGIRPRTPGFHEVQISPNPGALTSFKASMPHQQGLITVDFHVVGQTSEFHVTLPGTLSGIFQYRGNIRPLHGGEQTFTFDQLRPM